MKIVDVSIRRPVTVFIFALAAVVFGVVAFKNLAVNLLPDITYPSLTVRTSYDGAAPLEVESLITRPVENAVGVVNGVVSVTPSSRADRSEVTLEFGWGTNMDFAALDVRERLDLRLGVIEGRNQQHDDLDPRPHLMDHLQGLQNRFELPSDLLPVKVLRKAFEIHLDGTEKRNDVAQGLFLDVAV